MYRPLPWGEGAIAITQIQVYILVYLSPPHPNLLPTGEGAIRSATHKFIFSPAPSALRESTFQVLHYHFARQF
jgi:hypothetical protein